MKPLFYLCLTNYKLATVAYVDAFLDLRNRYTTSLKVVDFIIVTCKGNVVNPCRHLDKTTIELHLSNIAETIAGTDVAQVTVWLGAVYGDGCKD